MTTSKRTRKILSRRGHVLYECELPDGVPDEMATKHALEKAVAASVPLEEADLTCTDLAYANLGGANLARANLLEANLANAYMADAYLVGAQLSGADLTGADLTHANLTHALLHSTNLTSAKLTCARLTDAGLERADLDFADLSRAILTDADLFGANMEGAYLTGTELAEAILDGTKLTGADLRGLKLAGRHPLLRIGPIGANGRTLLAWLTEAGLRIQTSSFFYTHEEFLVATSGLSASTTDSFFGTREEFRAAIAQAHGDDPHAQEYLAALALIDKHAELWLPKAQPDAKAGTPDASETDDPSHI